MSKKILLADDSVTIQKVVELTFMEEDVEVVTVGSGEAALSRWSEVEPDLLIADVHMPGPDGFEVTRRIKAARPGLPVLLLVGTFEPFDTADVAACGADGFLKKPFDSQELIRKVEDLLASGSDAEADAPSAETMTPVPLPVEVPVAAPAAAVADPEPVDAESAPARRGGADRAGLSEQDLDRLARRVAELLSDRAVKDVAWEVIPDLAEVVIRERLRELEGQVD